MNLRLVYLLLPATEMLATIHQFGAGEAKRKKNLTLTTFSRECRQMIGEKIVEIVEEDQTHQGIIDNSGT